MRSPMQTNKLYLEGALHAACNPQIPFHGFYSQLSKGSGGGMKEGGVSEKSPNKVEYIRSIL